MTSRRKLIEVDLPLAAINKESAREKSLRHGHPSTLHLYWARRPLAACRAVIFASLVDDPEDCPEEFRTQEERQAERQRLHELIERLVVWENVQPDSQDDVLGEARREIARSLARGRGESAPTDTDAVLAYLREHAPPLHDPFAGGGSIPLEAQRLGLRAIASDLNPLAVLINKALIELPPKIQGPAAGQPGGGPHGHDHWQGTQGAASRLARRSRAGRRHPLLRALDARRGLQTDRPSLSESQAAGRWRGDGDRLAVGAHHPLPQSGLRRANAAHAHLPAVDEAGQSALDAPANRPPRPRPLHSWYRTTTRACPRTEPWAARAPSAWPAGVRFRLTYVRERAWAGELGEQMTTIVAEGARKRLFLSPDDAQIQASLEAKPAWRPNGRLPKKALSIRAQVYGFTEWHLAFHQAPIDRTDCLE